MRSTPRGCGLRLAALALAAAQFSLSARAATSDAEFVASEADGVVEVEGETRVEVEGIEGEIVVQGEAGRAIRFRSSPVAGGEAPPVGVFLTDDAILFRPPPDAPSQRRQLLLIVPRAMGVRIRANDSRVVVFGLAGRVDAGGQRLDLSGRVLTGAASFDLVEGRATLDEVGSDTQIRGKGIELRAGRCDGRLRLRLSESRVEVSGTSASLEAELRDSALRVADGSGGVDLDLAGGSAELTGLTGGIEARASGTPLRVTRSSGGIEAETDGSATFAGNKGALQVTFRGGTTTVEGHVGALTVQGSDGELAARGIEGAVVVKGNRLKIDLAGLSETLTVTTEGSELSARQLAGAVSVASAGGSVTLIGAASEVAVNGSGDVFRLDGLAGPLHLSVDAPGAEVGWSGIPAGKESLVQNDGGDLTIRFPEGGECRVDAESSGGRVESELPWIVPSDDAARASGIRGASAQHRIVVRAGGDVRFAAAGAP